MQRTIDVPEVAARDKVPGATGPLKLSSGFRLAIRGQDLTACIVTAAVIHLVMESGSLFMCQRMLYGMLVEVIQRRLHILEQ